MGLSAPDSVRVPAVVTIDNRTPITAEVRVGPDGAPESDPMVVRRGDRVRFGAERGLSVGDELIVVEPRSLTVLSRHVVETASDTHVVVLDDHDELTFLDEWGAAPELVPVRFRNTTPFDIELHGLAPGDVDGGVPVTTACPLGHSVVVDSMPLSSWRATTAATSTRVSGDVPAGIELGRYPVGMTDATHDVENTVIGFENASWLDAEVVRVLPDGREIVEATLSPMAYVLLPDALADRWRARDRRSGANLWRSGPSWSPRLVEISGHHVEAPAPGATARDVRVTNATLLPVLVQVRTASRGWTSSSMLEPGGWTTVSTVTGGEIRAAERRTGAVVGQFVAPDDADVHWRIAAVDTRGAPTVDVEISNETHVDAWLVDLGSGERTHVGVRGRRRLRRPLGSQVVLTAWEPRPVEAGSDVVDRVDGVFAVGAARRLGEVVRPRPGDLEASAQEGIVELTIANETGEEVLVQPVWGDHARVGSDEVVVVRTVPEDLVRCLHAHSRATLREVLVGHAPAQHLDLLIASAPRSADAADVAMSIVNRSLLPLELCRVDIDGQLGGHVPLGPTEVVDTTSYAGESWIARDPVSSTIVWALVVERTTTLVELTTDGVRSVDRGGGTRRLTVTNELAHPLTIVEVTDSASPRPVLTVAPTASGTVPSAHGRRYLAQVSDPALTVSEFIVPDVPGSEATWSPTLAMLRRLVPAAASPPRLAPGHVAAYAAAGFSGAGVVTDRPVPAALLAEALSTPGAGRPPAVGSLRLGPRTSASVVGDDGARHPVVADVADASGLPTGWQSLDVGQLVTTDQLGITRRALLTQDYRTGSPVSPGDPPGVGSVAVYRTTMTFPPDVRFVDVTPTRAVTLRALDGTEHTHDPEATPSPSPIRLEPDGRRTITVSIDADDLSAPSLELRTNTMVPGEVLLVHPDEDVHAKVAALGPSSVRDAKQDLGMGHLADEACDHVQATLQNLSRTVQHGYRPTPHGVEHERRIGPEHMTHRHWAIDVDGGTPRFRPVSQDEVEEENGPDVRHHTDPVAQGIFDGLAHDVGALTKVVVHTARKAANTVGHTVARIAHDAETTASHVANDVERTATHVGKDLVRGDLAGAMGDVADGTLSVGRDVVTGALHVGGDLVDGAVHLAGDLVEGAEELVVATIHLAGDAFQFVLTHTGVVGELISAVLHRIGAAIEHVVSWLMSKLGWDGIWHTFDQLSQLLGPTAIGGRVAVWTQQAEEAVDHALDTLESDVDRVVRDAMSAVPLAPSRHEARPAHHNDMMDKLGWLLSHGTPKPSAPPPGTEAAAPPEPHPDLTIDGLMAVVGRGVTDPGALLHGLLGLVREVIDDAIEAARQAIDALLESAGQDVQALVRDLSSPSVPVPVIGPIFHARWGRDPTPWDLGVLVLALPMDIGYRGTHHEGPVITAHAMASGLEPPQYVFGFLYGLAHTIQAELALFSAPGEGIARTAAPISDFVALMTSAPVELWTDYLEDRAEGTSDVDRAPADWGDAWWFMQFVTFLLKCRIESAGHAGLDTETGEEREPADDSTVGDAIALLDSVSGFLQLVPVVALAIAEGTKGTQAAADDGGYRHWVADGGHLWKAGGNVLDVVPTLLDFWVNRSSLPTGPTMTMRAVLAAAHAGDAAVLVGRMANEDLY